MDAAAHGGQIACEASLVDAATEEFHTVIELTKRSKQRRTEASQSTVVGSDHHPPPPPSPSPFARLEEDEVSLSFPPPSGKSISTLSRVVEEKEGVDDHPPSVPPLFFSHHEPQKTPSPNRLSAQSGSAAGSSSSVADSSNSVAGPSTSAPVANSNSPSPNFKKPSYLALLETRRKPDEEDNSHYSGHALAVRIGDYQFKGNPESIEMVYLVNEGTESRT